MSRYGVSFNGYDLEDTVSGLIVVSTDPYRMPNQKIVKQQIARNDLSTVSSRFWTDKKATITVEIGRNTRALLEASVDRLKTILQGREKTLIVPQGSANRQYTATVDNLTFRQPDGGHQEIDIEFFCSDPYGYDTSSTTLYNYANLVGGAYDFKCTFEGSAEVQKPVITITINSVSTNTNGVISIANNTKSLDLEIARTWVAADVLIVDCLNRTVKVNGTEVDFTGPIPDWDTGVGNVSYADDFTTRNIALSIAYRKRYL